MATFLATVNPKATQGLSFGSPFNERRWQEWCQNNEGKRVEIKKPKSIRSLTQNALYHVWLAKVELETGNQSEDMHEYLKHKFLPKRLIKIKGKKGDYDVETVTSTTKLGKLEFGEYLDKCASHTGVPLPTKEEIEALGYLQNS